jgi:hypothetical protein
VGPHGRAIALFPNFFWVVETEDMVFTKNDAEAGAKLMRLSSRNLLSVQESDGIGQCVQRDFTVCVLKVTVFLENIVAT